MAAAREDRDHDERHERERPRQPSPATATPLLACGKVRDERMEVGLRLRSQATLEPLLELVARQAPLQMLFAEYVSDGLALAVAGSQPTITRIVAAGVSIGHRQSLLKARSFADNSLACLLLAQRG